MTSSTLRDRLREATTREILDAAETVLAEQGVAAASMASIAQRAGVSVGTLYNYFKDKDQLLATILTVRRQEFATHLDGVAKDQADAPFEVHLEVFIRTVFQLFNQYRKFLRIVIEHAGDDKKKKLWLVDRMLPIVEKGLASGRLATEGAAVFPALFAGALSGVLAQRLDRPESSLARESDVVVAFLLGRAVGAGTTLPLR